MKTNVYAVTPESVKRAKDQQQRDRAEVFHKTGLRITDDGTAILPERELKIVHCGLCNYTVVRSSRDAATQVVMEHLVAKHMVHPFTAEQLEQAS